MSRRLSAVTLRFLLRSSTLVVVTGWLFFAGPRFLNARTPARGKSAGDGAPSAHLVNISTRLAVGTGDNVLFAGFIISGNEPKRVVVRGLGPTLPVVQHLDDPTLALRDSSDNVVGSNDNWRDSEDELRATQIPPRNDYESGIVRTLNPGAYTAMVEGKGGTTGVGLVELYDLDQAADSSLVNVSTRGFVDRGDNVLIAGTIVAGSGSTNVLFRAIGPSITGIPNALQDTTLELYDGDGNVVAVNDNWQDTQRSEIEATQIPPPDAREAAILRELTPGAYTAIVRGKDDAVGIAVVEAYQIN
jgi:hypothetical protein